MLPPPLPPPVPLHLFQDAGPGPAAAAASVTASLRRAFLLVEQVRQLAERAQHEAPRPPGCSFGGPPGQQRSAALASPHAGAPGSQGAGSLIERRHSYGGGGPGGLGRGSGERAPLLRRLSDRSTLGALVGGSSRRRLLREDPTLATNPALS